MGTLLQDLRYGFRMLLKNPGFTIVAILAIGLGIGANTTMFSAVNALMLNPFSFENQERLVMLWERNLEAGYSRGSVSPANYIDWRDQGQTFEQVAAFRDQSFNLTGIDKPERVIGSAVTPNFFTTLNVKASLGRTFLSEDTEPGREQVVLIKHSMWQRRFGSDPNLIGKTLTLNGKSYEVVGIMPPDFNFPLNGGEIWTPLTFDAKEQVNRGNHYLRVMGLLKPGATIEQAQAEQSAISSRLQQQYPETNAGRNTFVESLTASYVRGSKRYLIILMGAVGFVLLIACANVANLLLVRGAARQKEIAIRMAMGASRWRLIRQLLTESVMLALMGGALGLLLSVWGIEYTSKGIPPSFTKYIAGWEKMGLNTEVFAYTFIISLLTGIIFGLAPALQTTKLNFNESLKEGGRSSSGSWTRNRLRSVLVISEVALSLVLLIGAGLMIRSFVELARMDIGFNPTNVLTMELSLPRAKYPEEQQRAAFYQQLVQRIETLPGVEEAAAINFTPMSLNNTSSNFAVEGRPDPPPGQQPIAGYRVVTPDYFNAIGTRIVRGRHFTNQDSKEAPRVMVINETLAKRFFPEGDDLGKRIIMGDSKSAPWEIVGVARDVVIEEVDEPKEPMVYVPYVQDPWWSMSLLVRSTGDPALLGPAVQNEVLQLDKDQPVYNVRTMDDVVDESFAPKRLATSFLGFFAVLALVLAAIGIYAVMSYSVSQRTHEIGIRMALGAQRRDILGMMVSQGLILTLIGLGLGLLGAFALTRAMSQILYGVSATDPLTFVGISLLLLMVAVLASFIPARKATKVDPMIALRHE